MFIEVKKSDSLLICGFAKYPNPPTNRPAKQWQPNQQQKLVQVCFLFPPHSMTFLLNLNPPRLVKWHLLPFRVTRAFRVNGKKQAPPKA